VSPAISWLAKTLRGFSRKSNTEKTFCLERSWSRLSYSCLSSRPEISKRGSKMGSLVKLRHLSRVSKQLWSRVSWKALLSKLTDIDVFLCLYITDIF